jgi:YgiT-type zinc finger domain-containing protein
MDGQFQGKEKIMKCMHCKGEMKRNKIPFHIDREGIHLSLDSLPAWVCQQCGEPYFEESEVDSIQAIIKAVEKQAFKFAKTA